MVTTVVLVLGLYYTGGFWCSLNRSPEEYKLVQHHTNLQSLLFTLSSDTSQLTQGHRDTAFDYHGHVLFNHRGHGSFLTHSTFFIRVGSGFGWLEGFTNEVKKHRFCFLSYLVRGYPSG